MKFTKIATAALALGVVLASAPNVFASRYHVMHHMSNGMHHARVKMHHGHMHVRHAMHNGHVHMHNMVHHGHM